MMRRMSWRQVSKVSAARGPEGPGISDIAFILLLFPFFLIIGLFIVGSYRSVGEWMLELIDLLPL